MTEDTRQTLGTSLRAWRGAWEQSNLLWRKSLQPTADFTGLSVV